MPVLPPFPADAHASNQKVSIYTTHIKKVIAKLYSFTLRGKIFDQWRVYAKWRPWQSLNVRPF